MTIGSADDIRAMQLEDVQAFFRTYYHPANASLVLAGDIDTARAFALAEQYFGDLTPGTRPAPVVADAALTREHRLVLEDRVELPRIYIAWLSPAMFAGDDAELDLVADLLANGKTSRLYRTLVYERRIALDVSAHQHSRELGSFFLLAATAAPGQSLADLAAEIDAELERVSRDGTVRQRNGARAGSGRGAVHVPPADGRRIWRQVRSAQCLQRLARQPRFLRGRPRPLSPRHARDAFATPRAVTCVATRASS